jgi:hypothetical protein
MTTLGVWTKRLVRPALVVVLGIAAFLVLNVAELAAQAQNPCAQADARLAGTGRGDRDHDGLSNCAEKQVFGTDHRDYDSDDDGVSDPDELDEGTDPTDADSDDDEVDDGEEEDNGSDPNDADSDDDGTPDGQDCDPADELESEIEGAVQEITCPTADTNGTLKLLGIAITLTPTTEFDDGASCAELVVGAHVEVEVTGDATTALTAAEVEVEDADSDGCPEDAEEPDGEPGASL